jgi:hypothetical protein
LQFVIPLPENSINKKVESGKVPFHFLLKF